MAGLYSPSVFDVRLRRIFFMINNLHVIPTTNLGPWSLWLTCTQGQEGRKLGEPDARKLAKQVKLNMVRWVE